jgi:hypothetical protein
VDARIVQIKKYFQGLMIYKRDTQSMQNLQVTLIQVQLCMVHTKYVSGFVPSGITGMNELTGLLRELLSAKPVLG